MPLRSLGLYVMVATVCVDHMVDPLRSALRGKSEGPFEDDPAAAGGATRGFTRVTQWCEPVKHER